MKNIIFLLLLTSVNAFSQNRYSTVTTTSYTPLSYEELSYVANHKKNQYDRNQDYLYSLKDWIRKLSSQSTTESCRKLLQIAYNDLVKIENKDLARYSTYLKQIEDGVKEVIDFCNTDALFLSAINKENNGDLQGAINDYDKIIERYPMQYDRLVDVYKYKADCLEKLERYNESLSSIEKALELDKTDADIWNRRGGIYLKLGRYNEAIQDSTTAISIKDNQLSRLIRGLAYSQLGQKVKAEADLKKAEQLKNK